MNTLLGLETFKYIEVGGVSVNLKHIMQKNIPGLEGNVWVDHAILLRRFYPSVEFDLLQTSVERRAKFYICCLDPFIDVTFRLVLRHKALFYSINFLILCIDTAFLISLAFYLSSQSGGKIALSINVLLGLRVVSVFNSRGSKSSDHVLIRKEFEFPSKALKSALES